ncbi:TonB-dependent receptor [Leptospira mtsangambouensis]|uniref:TonB-dependent receptor n=1 Tax=Leptospira mtsangambouensis TaxID=2484912 RepID=A0ABY2NWN0_9LEPT|nr:energy transducer TonB [Leptospira mtsangambouensis]TGM72972.1 TonB-dependent receptor [Leptospira mtsangambouensis]
MAQLSFDFRLPEKEEGERRLFFAFTFVILIVSFVLAHLITRNMLWKMLAEEQAAEMLGPKEQEKIYEVLVEQQFINPDKKDEYKALSNKDSSGGGGLTEKQGFHTLTQFREFIMGSSASTPSKAQPKSEQSKEEELFEVGIFKADPKTNSNAEESPNQSASSGQMTKIPFNYRFQQDFLFRWDGAKALTIPTKQLAGYYYFKNMLKRIEESFAPPGGGNYAYRDMAGIVAREGIKEGETKVLFMLSEQGQVLDVRLVTSQGQVVVDQACMDSIRGQNFGPVPEEVKAKGLIFGINFIFPGIRYYR